MRSAWTWALVVVPALPGLAVAQEREDGAKPRPGATELLLELQRDPPDPELVRELNQLISLDAEVRVKRSRRVTISPTYVSLGSALWSRFLVKLASSYRQIRQEGDECPIPVLQLLLLTMPCTAAAEGLQGFERPLTADEYRVLADDLLMAAKTPDGGFLAHVYKLHEGDRETRMRHALLLAQMYPASDVVPHLMEELDDEDSRVVQEAITALGMIGTDAEPAIPVLEKLTGHDDAQIALRAKAALRSVRRGRGTRGAEAAP